MRRRCRYYAQSRITVHRVSLPLHSVRAHINSLSSPACTIFFFFFFFLLLSYLHSASTSIRRQDSFWDADTDRQQQICVHLMWGYWQDAWRWSTHWPDHWILYVYAKNKQKTKHKSLLPPNVILLLSISYILSPLAYIWPCSTRWCPRHWQNADRVG